MLISIGVENEVIGMPSVQHSAVSTETLDIVVSRLARSRCMSYSAQALQQNSDAMWTE